VNTTTTTTTTTTPTVTTTTRMTITTMTTKMCIQQVATTGLKTRRTTRIRNAVSSRRVAQVTPINMPRCASISLLSSHNPPAWSGREREREKRKIINLRSNQNKISSLVCKAESPSSGNEAPPVNINSKDDSNVVVRTPKKEVESEIIPRPPLKVAAALALVGSLESTYLAVQKLSGGDVVCPVGGCQTALNSSYAELFGQPLSLYGAVAYFLVALLAFSGSSINPEESRELESKYKKARVLFFLSTCGLAGVSSYLLYVLAVKLGGVECIYCLTSASISFALFSIGFSGLTPKETVNASPPAVSLFFVTMLSLSLVLGFGADKADEVGESQFLSYETPRIETMSTQYSRELAKYLKESGAKMYGAFWCSHCLDQKEEFGKDTELPYVECFPDGWQKGTEIAKVCADAKVKGFPTWVINGKTLEGDKTLEELAKESGFKTQTPFESPSSESSSSIPDFLQ